MSSYNRVILVGNLTRDPQLSYTPSNIAVCKFGIATNRTWKDREGNSREDVCFVDCTLFGRAGETFNQYMSKGRSVLVEGRLEYHQWTTPEGDKRSKLGVFVENFTFLGSGQRSGGEGGGGYGGAAEGGGGQRGATEGGGGYRGAAEGGGGYRGATEGGAAPVSSGGAGAGYDEPPPPTDDDIPF